MEAKVHQPKVLDNWEQEALQRAEGRIAKAAEQSGSVQLVSTNDIKTVAEYGSISDIAEPLGKIAAKYGKPFEDVQLTSLAVSSLYFDNSSESRRAVTHLANDSKVHHTVKQFIVQNARRSLLRGRDNVALSDLIAAMKSDDAFVFDVAVDCAASLAGAGVSSHRELRAALRNALNSPPSKPKSIDSLTREEYSQIGVADALSQVGDYQTLLHVASPESPYSPTVRDHSIQQLRTHFAQIPEVASFLKR